MAYKHILYEENKNDYIGILTLNEPDKRNALGKEAEEEITHVIQDAGCDIRAGSLGTPRDLAHALERLLDHEVDVRLGHRGREDHEAVRDHDDAVVQQVAMQCKDGLDLLRPEGHFPETVEGTIRERDGNERALTLDHAGYAGDLECLAQPLPRTLAEPVEPGERFGRHLLHGGEPRSHAHRIGIERAGMVDLRVTRRAAVEHGHELGLARRGANRQPAADDLAERGHVGRDTHDSLRAVVTDAGREDLVEDEDDADA